MTNVIQSTTKIKDNTMADESSVAATSLDKTILGAADRAGVGTASANDGRVCSSQGEAHSSRGPASANDGRARSSQGEACSGRGR